MSKKIMVKIGGSAFDIGAKYIIPLCKEITKLGRNNKLYVGVGGGQLNDVLKDMKEDYKFSSKLHNELIKNTLEANTILVSSYLNNCSIRKPHRFKCKYNCSDSDATIIALADRLKIKEILFIKDTKGIFTQDPNIYLDSFFITDINVYNFDKISRIGQDGRDGHLIEDAGIDAFKRAKNVESITILDCKDKKCIEKWLRGIEIGSKIYK